MTHVLARVDGEHGALAEAVERAWCAAWSALSYDGATQVHDTPDLLRVLTPNSPDLLLNAILRYQRSGTVTREDVEAALAPHRAVCRPPQWWMRADTAPDGLRQSLVAAGMEVWGAPTGMALPLRAWHPPAVAPPEMTCVRVRHHEEAEAALRIITEVFGLDALPMRRWCVGNPHFMTYLALVRGTPAAALVLHVREGIAGFFHVATLPRFRHRGVASALMAQCLGVARDVGATTAALTASNMARDLYLRLGFVPCCQFELWMPTMTLMSAISYPNRRAGG